jgi:hypothetical protein
VTFSAATTMPPKASAASSMRRAYHRLSVVKCPPTVARCTRVYIKVWSAGSTGCLPTRAGGIPGLAARTGRRGMPQRSIRSSMTPVTGRLCRTTRIAIRAIHPGWESYASVTIVLPAFGPVLCPRAAGRTFSRTSGGCRTTGTFFT